MEFLLKIGFLILITLFGTYLYYFLGIFKKLGVSTIEELNEDEEKKEDLVSKSEAKGMNYFGTITFIFLGTFIWVMLGISAGKIASELTESVLLNRVGYIFIYFLFLRIPFGIGNKMIQKAHDLEIIPDKILFSFSMILFYILGICCFEKLPNFLTWHLTFL